jgi:hypothetical protein
MKIERGDIKNRGIDADPKNDPTYPIKKRTNEEHKGYNWQRPTQQQQTVEILQSVERNNITAVFGTSAPPSGLSGVLRRIAFKYSEGSFAHWLLLLFADRTNEAEGIFQDISRGHFPNILSEKGWNAEWKYNRKSAYMRVGKMLLLILLPLILISKARKNGD